MAGLPTVEAGSVTSAATTILSGLLGFFTFSAHVTRLPAIKAGPVTTATTASARLSRLARFLALSGHVAGLAAVEACVSATTAATVSAALLGPADSDLTTLNFGPIEVFNGFLCVLLFIEIDEAKAALLI